MAIKILEIRKKRWGVGREGFIEKVSFWVWSGMWNRDGLMHSESGDNDGDDELVRERWFDSVWDSTGNWQSRTMRRNSVFEVLKSQKVGRHPGG